MQKQFLISMPLSELQAWLGENGFPKYRAVQILEGLFKGKNLAEINIDAPLKQKLAKTFFVNATKIEKVFESKTSTTKKFLFKLFDGNLVEGVFMEYKHGNSFCVSTQVGCKMGCAFCASGKNGLERNLNAGEMTEFLVLAENKLNKKINSLVLMGSGEPLDNFDEVKKFLNIVCPPTKNNYGFNISNRNISLSTCGIVPKIYELINIPQKVTLSISLHATTDENRKKIMKIANAYKIKDVLNAAKAYYKATGRKIEIEYTLIKGINNTLVDVDRLAFLVSGFDAHVNIINLNATGTNLKPTTKAETYSFVSALTKKGVNATVRRVLGNDVGGACGQLRGKIINQNKQTEGD